MKKRILFIDDDKLAGESLAALLRKKDCIVHQSLSGCDGLEKIKKDNFDLLIIDYYLPDMNGLDVLKKIRKMRKDIPAVFVTAYGSENIAIGAFKLGVADYFIKPYNLKNFVHTVLEILNNTHTALPSAHPPITVLPKVDEQIETESSQGICRAVEYIKKHYDSNICLNKISKVAGYSKSHFMYRFKESIGSSFKEYLTHIRIINAKEILLKGNMTISEIAYAVGFNSLRQFERAFKEASGLSPTKYRKEHPHLQ